MPQRPSTDTLTILRHPKIPQTKAWKDDGTIQAHGKAKYYSLETREVDGIHAVSTVMRELAEDPSAVVIRGQYLGENHSREVNPEETRAGKVLRQQSVFRDVPRHYLMVDVDHYTPSRDPLVDPAEAVREWIEGHLPREFHGVSVHWQLSASFGHPTKRGLRVHIWVWLKTPYRSEELRRWADRIEFKGDRSLFNPIQLHYTANPILEDGVEDPVHQRCGFIQGEFGDTVHLVIPDDILAASSDGRSVSRQQKVHDAWSNDPLAQWLIHSGRVKSYRPDGGLNIQCLMDDEHSSESSDSSTTYFTAHTGGYETGTFKCLHTHGTDASFNRRCHEKARELGFDDLDDVFTSLDSTVNLLRADQITPEAIKWLMFGWLALGKLVLLAGSPGTGKTTLAIFMAATVTTGGKWPDGSLCEVGSVVIWSGEDDPRDTLVPRLLACGANLKRVHFVADAIGPNGPRPFDPAKDMALLLSEVQKVGDVRMILVDPIVSAVAGDSHKNAEVRRALQPLVDLAAKVGAVLLGITHFTKGTSGRDTTERVTGSLAFAALARVVLATARDVEAGDYLLTRSKSNIGPDGGGFRYHLEQVDIPDIPDLTASRVIWGDPIEGHARELIAEAEGDPKGKPRGNTVEEWLKSLLSLQPMKASEVYALGESQGYEERRLQRALKKIGGISEKAGFQGKAFWRLPGTTIIDPDDEIDPFGDVTHTEVPTL